MVDGAKKGATNIIIKEVILRMHFYNHKVKKNETIKTILMLSISSSCFFMKKWKYYSQSIQLFSACLVGFIGEELNTSCRYPSYGRNCYLTCDCRKKYCNVTIGCLQDTHLKQSEWFTELGIDLYRHWTYYGMFIQILSILFKSGR